MSSPRFPERDLRLERLGERDGMRTTHYGDAAHSAEALGPAVSRRELQAAYEALIDAVFTAPGAVEWLHGLRVVVKALLARKPAETLAVTTASEAIRPAEPGLGRPA